MNFCNRCSSQYFNNQSIVMRVDVGTVASLLMMQTPAYEGQPSNPQPEFEFR
jgi:hypothetical protein